MSAKGLGMIHTVNHFTQINNSGDIANIDLSGELTNQLERLVRQGNYFKVCGIDMTLSTQGTVGGGQVSGYIRYYAPTKGRCAAYRSAYRSVRKFLDQQGINVGQGTGNDRYDFRVAFTNEPNTHGHPTMRSQATLDGTNGLALYNAGNVGACVFQVYNEGVNPAGSVGPIGSTGHDKGFDTIINSSTSAVHTDFILDNYSFYSGREDVASLNWEFIPFTLSWTPDTTDLAISMQWRPDPALFLAVLAGNLQIKVEEVNLDGNPQPPGLELHTAVMVSGWKSIMGEPGRKKSSKKKKGGKK